MLNSNYTYDNRNLRDREKSFNAGIVYFYNADERVKGKVKEKYYFADESISLDSFLKAQQNNATVTRAIGIPVGGTVIEHGDIAVIGDDEYIVTHAQYQDYARPVWYKVYLERTTIPYETMD